MELPTLKVAPIENAVASVGQDQVTGQGNRCLRHHPINTRGKPRLADQGLAPYSLNQVLTLSHKSSIADQTEQDPETVD